MVPPSTKKPFLFQSNRFDQQPNELLIGAGTGEEEQERGRILHGLVERHAEDLAALDTVDAGKLFMTGKLFRRPQLRAAAALLHRRRRQGPRRDAQDVAAYAGTTTLMEPVGLRRRPHRAVELPDRHAC